MRGGAVKICRFWVPEGGAKIGFIEGDRVYDLTGTSREKFGSFSGLLGCDDLRRRIDEVLPLINTRPSIRFADLDIAPDPARPHLLAPITKQEVWAAGVTYLRSREARMGESESGGSFYDRVYHADRPELFFKGTANRVAGPNGPVRIRADSMWNVPEPELALVVNSRGALVAFTIGNDMSSRDIEGENPLYLPQAKVYQGSCALGPALVFAAAVPDPRDLEIHLKILRSGEACFEGRTSIRQMKRNFEDLISYLCREQQFPNGVILLTGTGVVPPDDFTLQHKDLIEITVPEVGTLRNYVE
jgi:2-dehydro-3-deoxy-D-arabinonate dehydratase